MLAWICLWRATHPYGRKTIPVIPSDSAAARRASRHRAAAGSDDRVSDQRTKDNGSAASAPDPPVGNRSLWQAVTRIGFYAAYTILIRFAIYLCTVALFVYFALNSPWVMGQFARMASAAIPGSVSLAGMRWGPWPGHLGVIRPEIRDPYGVPVLRASWIDVEVAWLPLLRGVVTGKGDLAVVIESARLADAEVRIDTGPDGLMRLAAAFAQPEPDDEPPTSKGTFRLSVSAIEATGIRVLIEQPAIRIEAEEADLHGSFDLRIDEAGLQANYEAEDVRVGRSEVWLAAFPAAGLPNIPQGRFSLRRVRGDLNEVSIHGMRVEMAHTLLADGSTEVRWQPDIHVSGRHLDLASSSKSDFVSGLLGPLFDFEAHVLGDFDFDAAGVFQAHGEVRGSGLMAGFPTDSVRGRIDLTTGAAGRDQVAIDIHEMVARAWSGEITSPLLTYRMRADDGSHVVACDAKLDGLQVADFLRSKALSLGAPLTLALDGVLNGRIDSHVRTRLLAEGEERLEVEATFDTAVTLRRPAGVALVRAVPLLDLRGKLGVTMAPGAGPAFSLDGVELTTVARAAGDGPLRRSPRQWLMADGHIDLRSRQAGLRIDANFPDLEAVLAPLGVRGVGGSVRLSAGHVDGDYLDPAVLGTLQLRKVRAAGYSLREARAKLSLRDGVLRADGLVADSELGHLSGDLSVALFGEQVTELRSQRRLEGRRLRLQRVRLGPLLERLGMRGYGGQLDLEVPKLAVDLSRPLSSLNATGRVAVRDLVVAGERLRRVDLQIEARDGQLKVDEAVVELDNGAEIRGEGAFDPTRMRYNADIAVPDLRFDQFARLRAAGLPLDGSFSGRVSVRGDRRDLDFDVRVSLAGLVWDGIDLGDAVIDASKVRGEVAHITSPRFFNGLKVLEGSEVRFQGMKPDHVHVGIGFEDLDPFAAVGREAPPGLALHLTAQAWADVALGGRKLDYHVDVAIPERGLLLEPGNGLEPLRNANPTHVRVDPTGVVLDSTFFTIGRHPLELCGRVALTPEGPPRLRFFAAGSLDVPRVGPLAESMAALDLRFDILDDPAVTADVESRCLKAAGVGQGRMRVSGTFDQLAVQGRIATRPSKIAPRGFGRDVLVANDGRLLVDTLKDGRIRLRIPREHPLETRIDDGRASAWGEVVLKDLLPESIELDLDGVDLGHTLPKQFSAVFTPRLHFSGSHLRDPERRKMVVAGDLTVTEGVFFRSFDKIAKIVGGVRGREVEGYSKSVLETQPWIGDIGLSLAVSGRHFEVQSRFPFGKTDVELAFDLKVGGTISNPEIFRRVKVLPGSTITYSVVRREFEVTQGSIDFRGNLAKPDQLPYLDMEARTEILVDESQQGQTSLSGGIGQDIGESTSGEQRAVLVFIRIYGPLLTEKLELNIDLRSIPAYETADIQSLLLTGRLLTANGSGVLGDRASINLLTDDLAQQVSKLLLSAVVDQVSVGVQTTGAVVAQVRKTMGRLTVTGQGTIGTDASAEYSGSFTFRISDTVSMEGLVRTGPSPVDTSNTVNTYEAKLRKRWEVGE